MIIYLDITALKSVRIRSVSSPYFTCIFPHTPYLSVFSPNAGKCGKIRTRITPNTGTSYAVYYFFLSAMILVPTLHTSSNPYLSTGLITHD